MSDKPPREVYRPGHSIVRCPECRWTFDLLDPLDATHYYHGHDCEGDTA